MLPVSTMALLLYYVFIEWLGGEGNMHWKESIGFKTPLDGLYYSVIILVIIVFDVRATDFIYFQF